MDLEPGRVLKSRNNFVVVDKYRDCTFGVLYFVENEYLPGSRFVMKVNLPLDELPKGNVSTNVENASNLKDHIARSVDEARITARLRHPNIIKVIDLVDIGIGNKKYKGIVYEEIDDSVTLEDFIFRLNEEHGPNYHLVTKQDLSFWDRLFSSHDALHPLGIWLYQTEVLARQIYNAVHHIREKD